MNEEVKGIEEDKATIDVKEEVVLGVPQFSGDEEKGSFGEEPVSEGEVSGIEPEEERQGSVVFVLDEETIKAHKMPRPYPGNDGERVAVSIPQGNPWLTEQILSNPEMFRFHGQEHFPRNPVDYHTMHKVRATFDPLFQEEESKPFKKATPMGMGTLGFRGYGGGRKFTGRGGQVHKVSESGEVLQDLVEPPLPGFKERFREVLTLAKTHAADVISSFRERLGEYVDEKLVALEETVRPKAPEKKTSCSHRRGTMGERFGKDRNFTC